MKILIYLGCISENAILCNLMLPYQVYPNFYNRNNGIICDLVSDNYKLLAKFHSSTLRIMDTMQGERRYHGTNVAFVNYCSNTFWKSS